MSVDRHVQRGIGAIRAARPRVAAVRPLATADVQAVIAGKEAAIRRYDRRSIQNWLVIVLDGSAASFATLSDSARNGVYTSAFKQVHFLDIAAGTCTHLHAVVQGTE